MSWYLMYIFSSFACWRSREMIAKLYTRQVSQATHMSFSVHRFRVMQRFVSSHRERSPDRKKKFINVDDVTYSGKLERNEKERQQEKKETS